MKVFNGVLKTALRNVHVMFAYLIFYLIIIFMMQASVKDAGDRQFEAVSLPVAVIDQDGGKLAKGITAFLKKTQELVELETDKEVLQEALFYREVQYILTIPRGIETLAMETEEPLLSAKVPGSTSAYYVDQQINTYLNQIRVYMDSGYSMEQAVQSALALTEEKAKVTLHDRNGNGGVMPKYLHLFRFFPYIFISAICLMVSIVMIEFQEKERKRRLQCAPISLRRQNGEQILAFFVVGMIFWVVVQIFSAVAYTKEFIGSQTLGYLLMNTFVLMLVSLALSFLIGTVAKNSQVIQGAVNVVSLGMCFLGGIFVPYEILGKSVQKAAQLLPVYWYGKNIDMLGNHVTFTAPLRTEFLKGLGLQIAFAVACVSVTLAITKYKAQKKT